MKYSLKQLEKHLDRLFTLDTISVLLHPRQGLSARELAEDGRRKSYDFAFLANSKGLVTHYVKTAAGNPVLLPVEPGQIAAGSSPIRLAVPDLVRNRFLLIITSRGIEQIVTLSDLEKPPVRMWVFSMMSLLELGLKNLARELRPSGDFSGLVPDDRLQGAIKRFNHLKQNNLETDLVECLYFFDLLRIQKKLAPGITEGSAIRHHEISRLRNTVFHNNPISRNFSWETFSSIMEMTGQFISRLEEQAAALPGNR